MQISTKEENWFWSLINLSRKSQGKIDYEEQVRNLTDELSKLPTSEILGFQKLWNTLSDKAYTWDLWAAAYIINGGCSDDTFDDFRAWLIGQGKNKFYQALENPESLADFAKSAVDYEGLQYCASEAYFIKSGENLTNENISNRISEPMGKQWVEEDLPSKYPTLWQTFSNYKADDLELIVGNIDPTSFTVIFKKSTIPTPGFWKDKLKAKGHEMEYRLMGSDATSIEKVPYPDYSSYLLQLKKRISKDLMGILIKSTITDARGDARVTFENYDEKLTNIFSDLSIISAEQENISIESGSSRLTGQQWLEYIKTGSLPD